MLLERELTSAEIVVSNFRIGIEGYSDEIEAQEIVYLSGGVKVKGYVVAPTGRADPLPCIVYNRGGNRELGLLHAGHLRYFAFLASKGYVVMASQYRGCAGGEGNDEFGGSDVLDVTTLLKLADNLSVVDRHRKYLYGGSRGGMMTYLAIKAGADVCAAVVLCGATDLFDLASFRPEMYTEVMLPLIGDMEEKKDEYIHRSAVYWPQDITVPVLIIHGEDDERLPVEQAKRLCDGLDAAGRKYRLVLLPDTGHDIMLNNRELVDREVFAWFEQHSVV